MKRVEPLPEIPSIHSQALSSVSDDSNTKENTRDSIQIDYIPKKYPKNNNFQKPKPIGIYNFSSNKSTITSLEQNIDEVVSSFIEKNKFNIIECVTKEVQKKFDEKIIPMSTEISNIKQEFLSLYENEWTDFKQSNVLDECHTNIIDLNNKVDIMRENISKYNDNIKGFNIADNRLQFLNKLNKDLENFILGIQSGGEVGDPLSSHGENMMDLEENIHKIEKEQRKQDNLNQELDNVFYDTMKMLKDIVDEDNNSNSNKESNTLNSNDILNEFKNVINTFDNKFNYKKPFMEKKCYNMNLNNNTYNGYFNENCRKNENNPFDGIPNFFD